MGLPSLRRCAQRLFGSCHPERLFSVIPSVLFLSSRAQRGIPPIAQTSAEVWIPADAGAISGREPCSPRRPPSFWIFLSFRTGALTGEKSRGTRRASGHTEACPGFLVASLLEMTKILTSPLVISNQFSNW